MGKTTLYLTRHGQTEWNVERRAQGHLDSPLTELGIRQAMWLRDTLIHIDFTAIYSSSSLRAYRTAQILQSGRTCELIARDDLREIKMGTWEGKTRGEIWQTSAAAQTAYKHTPHLYQPDNGGESFYDLQTRVVTAFNELATRHKGQTILIVAHGVTLKTLLNYLKKQPLEQLWQAPFMHPTALNKVVIENGQAMVEIDGDISHYPQEDE